jgi:hypothetical protein
VLTSRTIVTQAPGEAHGLALAQVFEVFPYALLRAHGPLSDRSKLSELNEENKHD